jgi:hypothetical protein
LEPLLIPQDRLPIVQAALHARHDPDEPPPLIGERW